MTSLSTTLPGEVPAHRSTTVTAHSHGHWTESTTHQP